MQIIIFIADPRTTRSHTVLLDVTNDIHLIDSVVSESELDMRDQHRLRLLLLLNAKQLCTDIVGCTNVLKHRIDLTDDGPVRSKNYRSASGNVGRGLCRIFLFSMVISCSVTN